ncbi:MAG: DNA methyltransferase [Rhizobiaceae bacterium]
MNLHPTVKPVAMVRDAILDSTDRGKIILNQFCGSGSTPIAAHQTGRLGYRIEIDPQYCDVIIRRVVENSALTTSLGEIGPDVDAVAAERAASRSVPVLEVEGA